MTQIAILGFGNIGSGVAEMLKRNADYIREASGDDIAVKYVLDKRDLTGSGYEACAVGSIDDIVSDPSVSTQERLRARRLRTSYWRQAYGRLAIRRSSIVTS